MPTSAGSFTPARPSGPSAKARRVAAGALAAVVAASTACFDRRPVSVCYGPGCADELCPRRRCDPGSCDIIDDGCGGTADCGTCALPQVCGGSGAANVCGTPLGCAQEPLRTAGERRFVCDCAAGADPRCQPGDDVVNDGTSPEQPWRSYGRARTWFRSMKGGDTLALCRGGAFDASAGGSWTNARCSAGATCDARDYSPPWGDGSEARPLLIAGTEADRHVIAFFADSSFTAGYRFMSLELRGPGGASPNPIWGVVLWDGQVTDLLLCDLVLDGFDAGVQLLGSPGPGRAARVVLRESRVINSTSHGFVGSCSNCAILSNTFADNGTNAGTDSSAIDLQPETVNGAQGGVTTLGMRVSGNRITRTARRAGSCLAKAIAVSGHHQALEMEDNVIEEPVTPPAARTCSGIELAPDAAAGGSFRDVAIRRNQLWNLGADYLRVSSCDRCTIEDNLVVGTGGAARGIIAPAIPFRAGLDAPSAEIVVRNNTLVFGPGATGELGIAVGGEGSGHVVASNAVVYAGDSATDGWSCFELSSPAASYAVVDHNLCWFPGAAGGSWERSSGGLSSWQAASGLDASSKQEDPRFVSANAPDYDFTPGPGSPLLGGASPEQFAPVDLTGKRRDPHPDIGAFER